MDLRNLVNTERRIISSQFGKINPTSLHMELTSILNSLIYLTSAAGNKRVILCHMDCKNTAEGFSKQIIKRVGA